MVASYIAGGAAHQCARRADRCRGRRRRRRGGNGTGAVPRIAVHRVRAGTRDMTREPALTRDEVTRAIEVGITVARDLSTRRQPLPTDRRHGDRQHDGLGRADRGVHRRLRPHSHRPRNRHRRRDPGPEGRRDRAGAGAASSDPGDPIAVLAAGRMEHAALAGFLLAAAALRTPVVLDGVTASRPRWLPGRWRRRAQPP